MSVCMKSVCLEIITVVRFVHVLSSAPHGIVLS